MQQKGRVRAGDGAAAAHGFPPAALGEQTSCGPQPERAERAAKAGSLRGMGMPQEHPDPGTLPGAVR